MAGTYTPNFNLYKPSINEIGWAALVNNNWAAIDAALATATGGIQILAKNVDYTIAAGVDVVLVDASGGNRVITLPAVALSNKRVIRIKKTDSSANLVTVDGNASDTIDGALTKILGFQYQALTLICDGVTWHIFS